MKELDLDKGEIGNDIEAILLDRIQKISGLKALANLPKLYQLQLVHCGTDETTESKLGPSLEEVTLLECELAIVRLVLSGCRPVQLQLNYFEHPVADLGWIAHSDRLTYLRAWAGLVRGARNLERAPLRKISFRNAAIDDGLRGMLRGCAPTLEELKIENDLAFGPDELPELNLCAKLRSLVVPAYPEFKRAWTVEFNDKYPDVKLAFSPVPDPLTIGAIEVVEIYRGVDILSIAKGKTKKWQIYGNIVGEILRRDNINNHVLGEALKSAAVKAKKKLEIFTSSDELIATSKKLEDVKWAVDQIWAMSEHN